MTTTPRFTPPATARTLIVMALATGLMAACGGGGGDSSSPSSAAGCDVESQKRWLRDDMLDKYYWSGTSPNPEPASYATVADYLDALRFAGDATVPRDRWSYISDTASYNQFFGAGLTLGYGLQVNGRELQLPLRARYVEPQSPAALAGITRGDTIVSVNGRSAADIVGANDFSSLSPAKAGDVITVVIDSAAGTRSVVLTAAVYGLVPVSTTQVLTLADGRKAGYLFLKDFVSQAEAPLAQALAEFSKAGATELILDLRYNGGGLVSTAALLASLIGGSADNGRVFTTLNFNARNAASNRSYVFNANAASPFTRAIVLTGVRTCSASELVVNGLKPHMSVVTIGAASCGKPFGFVPKESCGSTYSAVNFESFNAAGQGRYYDGIAPTCAVAEDFTRPLGNSAEVLTAAAANYIVTGACPAASNGQQVRPSAFTARQRAAVVEPGDRQGMWVR